MAFIIRPDGDTDLINAQIVAESTLPQTIGSLAAGTYEVGRVAWAVDPVTVTAPSTTFVMNGAYFLDPTSAPANTSVMEFEVTMTYPTESTTYTTAFSHISSVKVETSTNNPPRVSVEDSAESTVAALPLTEFADLPAFVVGTESTLNVVVNWQLAQVTVTMDGVSQTIAFAGTPASIYAQTGRSILFGANTTSVGFLPSDVEVERFRAWFTTSGTRTLRKEISIAAQGSIAGINADPWQGGGDVLAPS